MHPEDAMCSTATYNVALCRLGYIAAALLQKLQSCGTNNLICVVNPVIISEVGFNKMK